MYSARSRSCAVLFACGVFGVLPCSESFQGCCSDPGHNESCEVCWPILPVFVSVARVHADEPLVRAGRPPLSSEAKASLEKLVEGNRRFVADKPLNLHASREWREKTAHAQKPFAAILGCADSRVPPEIVFDQGLGDLFVVRVAGNIVDTDVTGSLEYAARHLGVRLFIVLGHEHCGAVSAVVEAEGQSDEPEGLQMLLHRIQPALKGLNPELPKEERINVAVEANVRWSIDQLSKNPRHKKAIDEGEIFLIGAVYEMETGKVHLLE